MFLVIVITDRQTHRPTLVKNVRDIVQKEPVSVAQWANPHEPQCATRPDWLVTATGPGSTLGLGVSFSASWTNSRHALRLSLG